MGCNFHQNEMPSKILKPFTNRWRLKCAKDFLKKKCFGWEFLWWKVLPGVSFINVLSARFSYESPFFWPNVTREKYFRKKNMRGKCWWNWLQRCRSWYLECIYLFSFFKFQFKIVFLQFFWNISVDKITLNFSSIT